MVSQSDAIANPWAVMVHSQDALLANFAVVGSGRFNSLASIAIGSFLELCDLGRAT